MTPREDHFRAKASRPEFRRAGLVLGMSAWTEFTLAVVGTAGMQRLAADPVVTLQIQDGKAWVAMPTELRARWAGIEPEDDEAVDEDLLAQLADAHAKIVDLDREISDLIDGRRELQDDLAAARQEIADLGDVNEAQKAALATIDGLRDQVADLTAQLAARPPASTDIPEEQAKGQEGDGDPAVPAKPDASGAKTSAKAKTPAKSE